MRNIRSRRAISPVIATVILVAVAITVAVAVAYWMGGIASQYTKFEKVEIQTAYSKRVVGSGWNVTLELKNTGTADATLIRCFVNDRPIEEVNYGVMDYAVNATSTSLSYSGTTIESGDFTIITVWIHEDYAKLSSGTTVNIKIHSAGGMDYIKLVELI